MGTEVTVIFTCQDEIYAWWYECDTCGETHILSGFKFCPKCGGRITKFEEVDG